MSRAAEARTEAIWSAYFGEYAQAMRKKSTLMNSAETVDKTRPHKLAMPPGVDAAEALELIYQYLDDGELVKVPNTPKNQTPGVMAQAMRIRQEKYLKMAEEALTAKAAPDWKRHFDHESAKRRAQEMAEQAKVYDDLEHFMCSGYHTSGLPLPDRVHYARTRAALAEYLATKPERDAQRDAISDPASCRAWEIVEQKAEVCLQYAYFFDTSDVHDRDDCRRITALEIFNLMDQ